MAKKQKPAAPVSPMEALKNAIKLCQEKIPPNQHARLDRLANQLIGFVEGNSG